MLRVVFMGAITVFLMYLYAHATWYAIQSLRCLNATPPCTNYPIDIPDSPLSLLSFIEGLVSALVISVLAVTPPNTSPGQTIINSIQSRSGELRRKANWPEIVTSGLTYVYLLVWLACGIFSVWYVFMAGYRTPLPELTTAAKSWLGLAVAAAYAFFGLRGEKV